MAKRPPRIVDYPIQGKNPRFRQRSDVEFIGGGRPPGELFHLCLDADCRDWRAWLMDPSEGRPTPGSSNFFFTKTQWGFVWWTDPPVGGPPRWNLSSGQATGPLVWETQTDSRFFPECYTSKEAELLEAKKAAEARRAAIVPYIHTEGALKTVYCPMCGKDASGKCRKCVYENQ